MLKAEDVFFFDQDNPKRFETRRTKKYPDDIFSNFGDRKESVIVRPGDAADTSSVITTHTLTRKISVAAKEGRKVSVAPQAAAQEGRNFGVAGQNGRKVSVLGHGVHLPPVDPHGPNFIRGSQTNLDSQKDFETKSILSERKFEQLKEVEEKIDDKGKKEDSQKQRSGSLWRLNEAKFASTGILSKLGKLIEKVSSEIAEITLPAELVDELSKNYTELSEGLVVEKREWQTDIYRDFQITTNNLPFLTDVPPEPEQEAYKSALKNVVAQQNNKNNSRKIFGRKPQGKEDTGKQEKRVRMSREAKGDGRGVGFKLTPERPMTARSTTSNYSYKSDYSDETRDSIDYSRLPAELCPTVLHYRRESSSLKVKQKEPLTRMEKVQELKRKNNKWGKTKKVVKMVGTLPSQSPGLKRAMSARPKGERPMSAKPPSSGEDLNTGGNAHMPKTVIAFSMSSAHQSNEDLQDWLVHPSDSKDPEAHTLRMWDKKLKELHRKMEEAKHLDKKNGADKPLVVKFYNDPQLRSLRLKHQRSSTVPLPAAFSKLPPSIGSISPPGANEVLLLGEGAKAFVLTLPDGSGYCRYPSGNLAVSLSRCDMGGPLGSHKGLYTLVFDDSEDAPLLAYFTPLGKACCYHKNGAIKMFSDSKGGSLYNENGEVTRKWEWPPVRMSMPVPVNIHLNVHISVRCSSLTSMDLRVSVRSQSYKFNIASSPEDLLDHMGRDKDLSAGTISSRVLFFSQAAQSRMPVIEEVPQPDKSKKGGSKSKRVSRRSRHENAADAEGSTVNDSLSSLLSESDKYSHILAGCKKAIHELVDQWLGHYCSKMGIRSRTPSSLSRANLASRSRGRAKGASEARLVKSSLGYVSSSYHSRPPSRVQIARSLTHPLNSRASSRPVSSSPTSDDHLKLHSPAGSAIEEVEADNDNKAEEQSHTVAHSQNWRSSSAMLLDPSSKTSLQLKGTLSKSKLSSSHKKAKVSCPVALHKMMEDKLPTLPQCKCAKHHVPFIFDLEFDRFLKEFVPQSQLIVVCIKSSLKERSCPCEPLVDSLYSKINKVRFSPCLLASQDRFRLFKYDLDQPVGKESQPLLVRRHNARAGMFMMYMRGELVYADNVFNGYSNTETDFIKQITYSIEKGTKRQFLPGDFKFSRDTGSRIMPSDTWAYPVSGIMHDLIPFSPQSDSGVSTPQNKPSQSQLSMSEVLMRSHGTSNSFMGDTYDEDDDDEGDLSSLQLSTASLVQLKSSGRVRSKTGLLQRRKTDMHFKVNY